MTAFSDFPALERVAQVVDNLKDAHRQRQVCAFIAARYGQNLKPTTKKVPATPSAANRGEFAAIETAADELDQLTPDEQRKAVAMLAVNFGMEVAADYKPPGGGFPRKRKFTKG